jgi:hypothetical protein
MVASVYDAGPPETILWTIGDLNSGNVATLDIDLLALFASSGDSSLFGTAALTAPVQGDNVTSAIFVEPAIVVSNNTLDASGVIISTAQTGDAVAYEIIVRNDSLTEATGLEIAGGRLRRGQLGQASPAGPARINRKFR